MLIWLMLIAVDKAKAKSMNFSIQAYSMKIATSISVLNTPRLIQKIFAFASRQLIVAQILHHFIFSHTFGFVTPGLGTKMLGLRKAIPNL